MRSPRVARGLLPLLVVAGWSAARAVAADAAADDGTLEAITVTAERRSESIQEVPIAVTAVSGETLQKFGDLHFDDYAHLIPNLSFGTGSDFGVTNGLNVTIRGITGGRYRNGQTTTSFYVDDTPVPLSLDPRVLDLQRIEVLRGPQGTLFGSSAMGGTIRVITRPADSNSSYGSFDVQGFDINRGGAGYDVSGTYNLPLISDQLALKVSGYTSYKPGIYTREWGYPTSPGYTLSAYPQTPGEETHVGSDSELGGMAELTITPSAAPGLTVTPMVIYQVSRGNGLPLSDYTPANLTQLRPLDVPESTKDEWTFSSLTIRYKAPFGSFISSSTWFHRGSFDDEDGTEAAAVDYGTLAIPSLANILASSYLPSPCLSYINLTTFTQEARFESAFDFPVQVIVGGYYTHGKSHTIQDQLTPYDSTGQPAFFEDVPNSNNEVAEFGDITYTPWAPLELSAGIRASILEYHHVYYAYGWENGGPSNQPTSHEEHAVTPRYTAKYQIDKDDMVYASAAKGFRIGGANSLPTFCDSYLPAGDVEYKSDSLWSYEVGLKDTLFDGKMQTRIAAYRINWTNIQQAVLPPPPCNYNTYQNAGAATSTGAEVEADMVPVRGLNVSASAGFDNAKITSVPAGAQGFSVGQTLSGVPHWTAALLGDYSVPASFGSEFVRAQYSFTGRSVSYNNTTFPDGRTRDEYSLVDVHLGTVTGPWETSLFVKNLFDARANLGDEQSEVAELPGRPRWLIAQPRTMGVELRYKFNP